MVRHGHFGFSHKPRGRNDYMGISPVASGPFFLFLIHSLVVWIPLVILLLQQYIVIIIRNVPLYALSLLSHKTSSLILFNLGLRKWTARPKAFLPPLFWSSILLTNLFVLKVDYDEAMRPDTPRGQSLWPDIYVVCAAYTKGKKGEKRGKSGRVTREIICLVFVNFQKTNRLRPRFFLFFFFFYAKVGSGKISYKSSHPLLLFVYVSPILSEAFCGVAQQLPSWPQKI